MPLATRQLPRHRRGIAKAVQAKFQVTISDARESYDSVSLRVKYCQEDAMPEKVHTRFDRPPRPSAAVEAKKQLTNGIAPSRGQKRSAKEAFQEAPVAAAGPLKRRAAELLHTRKELPIFAHQSEIREHLRQKDVLLLVGETGSGKSTQVPQFLVNEPWCKSTPVADGDRTVSNGVKKKTVGGCIAITEPRRVAAISLARRVAEEVGTPLGKSSPASQVGYAVRFDNSTSPSTRIKFLTEGMLLQEMLRDPSLTQYSAVVVDEVHERGVNVDLVLGFLKRMLAGGSMGDRGGVPLKVVVMSATGNMGEIRDFFEAKDGQNDSRAASPGTEGAEVGSEWSGISGDQSVTATCRIEGRQYPVTTNYAPAPVPNIIDSALQAIFHIHIHEALPGDILVFLTGQETVENLETLCQEYAQSLDLRSVPKLLILPLFAALPQSAQQRVFERTPPRTRKVIIATNIAETSVTVPGVRYVIDCGKCKKKQFSSRLGLDSLLVKPISKSAANQRKGRAGREAAGTCYRLYTEQTYLTFEQDNDPEILRCDLTQMMLGLKARGVDDVVAFPLLTAPRRHALEKALLHLLQLKAIDEMGKITPLGAEIARLPVTPSLGCVLLAASRPDFDCLDECIDVIAALSVENVFLNTTTEEKKELADTARRELYRREGDHLTLLATVQAYASESADRKAWCEKRFVSHRAMKAVMDVRKQLTEILKRNSKQSGSPDESGCRSVPLGPLQSQHDTTEKGGATDLHSRILQAFLSGFIANTALLMPDGTYKTLMGKQTVGIHPSSVLFGRKVEAILYNEFVFTQKAYARGVSAVQMNWIGEAMKGTQ
jgi:ATP-dependent RNA helicase DHR2